MDKIVSFTCGHLEEAVRKALLKPTGNIYSSDMKSIRSLEIYHKRNVDLNGVEYAESLEDLTLYNCNINNLSSVINLKCLKSLRLTNNQIIDISSIVQLTDLRRLDISRNHIRDIRPIANLTKLYTGDFKYNPLETVFLPKDNMTQISYYEILKKIGVKDFIKVSALDPLMEFVYYPNKANAIKAFLATPMVFMFIRNELEETEVLDIVKEQLQNSNLCEQYIKELIKSRVLGSNAIDFIGTYGCTSVRAKLMKLIIKSTV